MSVGGGPGAVVWGALGSGGIGRVGGDRVVVEPSSSKSTSSSI